MATLYNTKISETYTGLIKTSNNGIIGAVEQNITDGAGNASTLSLGTASASFSGTLDLTNATVVGFSGGAVDSVNGQTGVVVLTSTNIAEGTNLYFTDTRVEANNAVVLNTAKVSFPEAPNDGQQYARQSQGWSVVVGGTGTVESVNGQTGVVILDTDNITEGTNNLYYTEARVNANSNVVANTAKVGITSQQATDITNNNSKVGITTSQANEIAANTLKVGITPTQASDITNNNAKVGITTQQASDITTNNAKVGITTAQSNEIAANTLKTGITQSQADDITANNLKVGITTNQSNEITANTIKVSFPEAPNDGKQYARENQAWAEVVASGGDVTSVNGEVGTVVLDTDDINEGTNNLYFTDTRVTNNTSVSANTAKVGITTAQATDISNNNAKVGYTDALVSANSNVVANTAKVGITSAQASDIITNNNKVGITSAQASDITANNAKTGITTAQADDIVLNTAKVGITSSQATEITNNTAKNSYPTADATKLAGIETGAEVNNVNSVNGATGVVSLGLLDLDDVGADGASGQVLTTDGNGAFTFTTVSTGGGGVSSVTGSGTVSGLTLTTGGTAANITLTLGGTLSLTSANVTDALTFTPYNSTNPDNYITGIDSSDVITALGFTPYNSTNPAGYISTYTVTSNDVTTALGFTPYSNTNPDGFISTITSSDIITALGFTPYSNTNPNNYDTTPSWVPSSDPNYLTGITSSQVTTALGFTPYDATNPAGYITTYTVTSGDVTGALGFTPYNSTNPDNFISSYTVTNSDVITALGFTPYNNTNPSNFTTNLGIVQSVTGNAGALAISNGVLNVPPTAGAPVDSVNTKTGVVVLGTDDIAEGTTNKYMVLGTSAGTALAGNTDLLQIGLTSTTALAGNTTTISGSQATDITNNNAKVSMVLGTTAGTALEGDTTTITPTQATAITDNTAKVGFTQTLVSQNTDVTNNTTKVSNVQSDWNATSGLAVILNKPSIPSAAPVDSVNGEIGTVVLDTSDIAENTNLYFTDARVDANTNVTNNTAKVGFTQTLVSQNTDVTNNTAKVSMIIGTAANEAMAGNTTTITPAQATAITNNTLKNSYPSVDATKLAGIDTGAQVNVQSDWNATSGDALILNKPTIPSAAPVDSVNTLTGAVVLTTANISEVTNLYYTEARVTGNSAVTLNTAKISFDSTASTKLSNIEAGAQVNTVDSVNGEVGAVTLTTSDVAEGTNKYMVLGTTASTALAGDTALLQLGNTSTTALAGDTTVISAQQATDITNNNNKISFDSTASTKLAGIDTGAEVNTIDSITSGEPSGSDQVINVVSLSQTEYDNGTKVATTFYIIT